MWLAPTLSGRQPLITMATGSPQAHRGIIVQHGLCLDLFVVFLGEGCAGYAIVISFFHNDSSAGTNGKLKLSTEPRQGAKLGKF